MSFWYPKGVGKYNKGFSKEVEIIDIWSQVSPRTLLVPRAVTPFSNRDVLSGHVYQRKQLSKIKFAPAAPLKQMHIVLQNLDLFKNWILKPWCYIAFPRDVNSLRLLVQLLQWTKSIQNVDVIPSSKDRVGNRNRSANATVQLVLLEQIQLVYQNLALHQQSSLHVIEPPM